METVYLLLCLMTFSVIVSFSIVGYFLGKVSARTEYLEEKIDALVSKDDLQRIGRSWRNSHDLKELEY